MRHTIILPLACLMLILAPVSYADSTDIAPPNSKIMKPIASIDTHDCITASAVTALVKPPLMSQNTSAPTSNCPTGYTAYGLNAKVSSLGVGGLGGTQYEWQTNCCREVITYLSQA